MKKLLVITGPTATGKTALGVALAEKLGGEVVSADSMQIYRGMDIGTAKPTKEEMRGVPHHMLDVAGPEENFSAARYGEMATACVEDIFARGKLPILVGGTGLYIDALVKGLPFAAFPENGTLRAELEADFDRLGGEQMRLRLRDMDPERAQKLHPADRKRIIRAMEVFLLTGRSLTAHDADTKKLPPRYDALKIALNFADRADLYARIDSRVDKMLEMGLLNEMRALLASGVPEKCTAMQAIGYKELLPVLQSGAPLEAAAEKIKMESRRYAKRQLTWLRREPAVRWLEWDRQPDLGLGVQRSTAFLEEHGII